jgi:hypothetical protein
MDERSGSVWHTNNNQTQAKYTDAMEKDREFGVKVLDTVGRAAAGYRNATEELERNTRKWERKLDDIGDNFNTIHDIVDPPARYKRR